MSLSSALFSGVSGLSTLGNAMRVIGDNIANVNTTGFKASRATFQDVLSQTVATATGSAQVGRGASLADISSTFAQGSFESTDSTTDLAIGGAGFFVVRDPEDPNNEFYTRAGEFRFDMDGNFVNPAGYIARGWKLDENGQDAGAVTDIILNSFTSPPDETDQITVITNLDSNATSNTADLELVWLGDTGTPPIDDVNYEYQTTVKVYDSLGSTHDVAIYYDVDTAGQDWEFIITCNPSEDKRDSGNPAGTVGAGLLARGVISFNPSSGMITGVTLDQYDPRNPLGDGTWANVGNAANWVTQTPNPDGYLEFAPDFIGGSPMDVELDIGCHYDGIATWIPDSLATTQYALASTTIFQAANGYGAGDLQSITVGTDGIITGQYSNGEVIGLYRVALANFHNVQELYKVGGNLFKETRLSGDPITARPGMNGLGNISPNSLEQSNVDLATEFVKMITTQRGFQANSKIVTVTDQMLAELIALKR